MSRVVQSQHKEKHKGYVSFHTSSLETINDEYMVFNSPKSEKYSF